jgi:hypothetical protein
MNIPEIILNKKLLWLMPLFSLAERPTRVDHPNPDFRSPRLLQRQGMGHGPAFCEQKRTTAVGESGHSLHAC